ncbi:MAG: (2Fe-2S)-binding protein [Elusimicrobiota bacterium]
MAEKKTVSFTLNGRKRQFKCRPNESLLELLRRAGYKGVKKGCSEGVCGVCTVIMDGRAVYSCILRAFQAEGRSLQTIEHMGDFEKPHAFQRALVDEGAVQCGFCTPGMVMAAEAMLRKDPQPSPEKTKVYMDGVLCRCTGYEKIWGAIRKVVAAKGGK